MLKWQSGRKGELWHRLHTLKEQVNHHSSGPWFLNPRALSVELFFLGAQDPAPSFPAQDLKRTNHFMYSKIHVVTSMLSFRM